MFMVRWDGEGQQDKMMPPGTTLAVLRAWGSCSSEGVLVFDDAGIIHFANTRLSELLGIPDIPPAILALLQAAESAIPALRSLLRPQQESERTSWGHLVPQSGHTHRLAWQRVPLEDASLLGGTVIVFREDTSEGRPGIGRQPFLSTISHDLRTPLSAIVGFAELLRNNIGSLSEDEQREFLGHILKNANDLTQYTQIALDIMFLEASPNHFELEDVFLARFVRHWLHDAAHRYPTYQVELQNKIGNTKPDVLQARVSPAALHKILSILLEFALRESSGDGSIQIRLDQRETEAHIVLRHHAPHLTQEEAGRLFALLAPRDLSEERRPQLHRMQLYVASLLAERQNGALVLRQQPDRAFELDLTVRLP